MDAYTKLVYHVVEMLGLADIPVSLYGHLVAQDIVLQAIPVHEGLFPNSSIFFVTAVDAQSYSLRAWDEGTAEVEATAFPCQMFADTIDLKPAVGSVVIDVVFV
ncbi:hypothetical protein IQ06DRAFT_382228 [Phaeosphaeriaceae sp. SRC1lsM3a]|nr:hypothetical protein IQ06DRAFT_382228 [Stagonospora sp. SRC1lsM3a]